MLIKKQTYLETQTNFFSKIFTQKAFELTFKKICTNNLSPNFDEYLTSHKFSLLLLSKNLYNKLIKLNFLKLGKKNCVTKIQTNNCTNYYR